MESIITVVAVGLLIGMMVLMVRYAKFIHKFPTEGQNKMDPEAEKKSNEDFHNKEPES